MFSDRLTRMMICLFALGAVLCGAQAQTPSPLPANYIRVNAPFAERIVVAEKARHDEIKKLGLHAVPPEAADNVIIANADPQKIGKKSSAADMEKLAAAKPAVVRIDKDSVFDLLLPITDVGGGDLNGGFLVMEVPYSRAANEEEALKIGIAIRDELQKQIPSREALYQP
jgi:hypothetical protein